MKIQIGLFHFQMLLFCCILSLLLAKNSAQNFYQNQDPENQDPRIQNLHLGRRVEVLDPNGGVQGSYSHSFPSGQSILVNFWTGSPSSNRNLAPNGNLPPAYDNPSISNNFPSSTEVFYTAAPAISSSSLSDASIFTPAYPGEFAASQKQIEAYETAMMEEMKMQFEEATTSRSFVNVRIGNTVNYSFWFFSFAFFCIFQAIFEFFDFFVNFLFLFFFEILYSFFVNPWSIFFFIFCVNSWLTFSLSRLPFYFLFLFFFCLVFIDNVFIKKQWLVKNQVGRVLLLWLMVFHWENKP